MQPLEACAEVLRQCQWLCIGCESARGEELMVTREGHLVTLQGRTNLDSGVMLNRQ